RFAPRTAPVIPAPPITSAGGIATLPSRKWDIDPDNVVKIIAANAVPTAWWTGKPNPTVKIDTVTPAPPAPIKPINMPTANITSKSVRKRVSDDAPQYHEGVQVACPYQFPPTFSLTEWGNLRFSTSGLTPAGTPVRG